MRLFQSIVVLISLTVLPLPLAAARADGAKLYKRCAACHLPTGKGVPGAYPPLLEKLGTFYGNPEGRAYLALVVAKGLTGVIDVDGVKYRGFMPPQGSALKDADIAAILNYVLANFHSTEVGEPYSAEEVAAIKASYPKAKARSLSQMRQEILAQVKGE